MTHDKNRNCAADSRGLGREECALCPVDVEANPPQLLFVVGL